MGQTPIQHPTPVSVRGAYLRPLRGALGSDVRQPDLGSPPAVASASGFGTGSGAGIVHSGSQADQSQGLVAIKVGAGPATTGTVVLTFPLTPPAMFVAADWATIAQGLVSKTLTLTWTGTRPLVPGETLLVAYQWQVST